jgi:hypothetical protein
MFEGALGIREPGQACRVQPMEEFSPTLRSNAARPTRLDADQADLPSALIASRALV